MVYVLCLISFSIIHKFARSGSFNLFGQLLRCTNLADVNVTSLSYDLGYIFSFFPGFSLSVVHVLTDDSSIHQRLSSRVGYSLIDSDKSLLAHGRKVEQHVVSLLDTMINSASPKYPISSQLYPN